MRFDEWQTFANNVRDRANRLSESWRNEARRLSTLAGLDPNLLGIHPHNAMCAYRAGNPWPGVDYAIVRRIEWILRDKQFEAPRLADRIIHRAFASVPR